MIVPSSKLYFFETAIGKNGHSPVIKKNKFILSILPRKERSSETF
jgi:hypothetical protein